MFNDCCFAPKLFSYYALHRPGQRPQFVKLAQLAPPVAEQLKSAVARHPRPHGPQHEQAGPQAPTRVEQVGLRARQERWVIRLERDVAGRRRRVHDVAAALRPGDDERLTHLT